MSKLEERERRRKSSVVGSLINHPAAASRRGRPKEDRELKKRVSLSVWPSLYGDIQKIAYMQRRSVSELLTELMEQYKREHEKELTEYEHIK